MSESAPEVLVRERVGRLDSVRGWRREVGKIYRAMRRGEIKTSDATRMAYVCDIGHRLVQVEEKLKQVEQWNKQLQEPQPALPSLEYSYQPEAEARP